MKGHGFSRADKILASIHAPARALLQSHYPGALPLAAVVSCGRIFLPAMGTHNTTLQYLTTTKIGEKGQLTVPKQFRRELGLATGAPFAVLRLGDGLILLPEQQRFEHLCQQVSSSLTAAGLTSEDLLATLPEARNRVYARRYGTERTGGTSRRPPRSHRGK